MKRTVIRIRKQLFCISLSVSKRLPVFNKCEPDYTIDI